MRYIYIQYILIHTDSAISVEMGFRAAVAAAHDSSAHSHIPISSWTGLEAGSPSAKCVWKASRRCRGRAFGPSDACHACGCAKTGPGVGPQWQI